jgi:hypothetical protein
VKTVLLCVANEINKDQRELRHAFKRGVNKLIDQVKCDIIRYHVLNFNCILRRHEGYFINNSLISMKKVISNTILKNIQKKYTEKYLNESSIIPEINNYLGPSFDKCYDQNYIYDNFDTKNVKNSSANIITAYKTSVDSKNPDEGEIIFRLFFSESIPGRDIKCVNLKPENTSLIIMTVINITDGCIPGGNQDLTINPNDENYFTDNQIYTVNNGKIVFRPVNTRRKMINNQPNPPYINLNKLKMGMNIINYFDSIIKFSQTNDNFLHTNYVPNKPNSFDASRLKTILENLQQKFNIYQETFRNRIKQYPFYANDKNLKDLLSTQFFTIFESGKFTDSGANKLKDIIDYIEANNETTLIGTTTFFNFTQISSIPMNSSNHQYTICDGINNDYNDNNIVTQPNIWTQQNDNEETRIEKIYADDYEFNTVDDTLDED